MQSLKTLSALAALIVAPLSAYADGGGNLGGGGGGGGGGGAVFGSISNASSAVAASGSNIGAVVYNYGYNGASWDQLQVDGSKSLKVNCITGCGGGAASNATSGVATSSTNLGSVSYTYGFNGTTWDQFQVDGAKSLKVNCVTGCAAGSVSNATSAVATSATNSGTVAYNYGFNGTTWDQLQVDANKNLKAALYQGASPLSATNGIYVNLLQGNTVNGSGNPIFANVTNGISGTSTGVGCGTNCQIGVQGNVTATDIPVSVAGTTSNAGSGVATSSASVKTISYGYAFNGTTWDQLQVDASKFLKVNCSVGCAGGAVSNATSAVATSSTNNGAVSWLYGFNGTTWDQLQVDASKFLKVNCATGCAAGTVSNATSGVATSATNNGSVSWLYGFNGTTWDQLQVDASKFLKVNCSVGCAGGSVSNATSAVATSSTNNGAVSWLYGFNGTTWDQLQVDGSKFLKINCSAGCAATGALSNASSGVATSSTNLGTVAYLYAYNGASWDQVKNASNAASGVATQALNLNSISYNYGFNGTTWDQLQVDASKFLKVNCSTGCSAGSISNATSGVATGATNIGTVAYNYGFNGTTWDQLQVDANKSLITVLKQGAAVLSATNGLYSNLLQGNAVLSASNPIFAGETRLVGATQTALHADPCQTQDFSYTPINLNTTTATTIVTGTASKKTYICSMTIFVAGAVNVGLIEGTTATCGTGTAGVIGGTTAATGLNFAANQGIVWPSAGHAHAATATNADNFCIVESAAVQLSGNIAWVQQ